MISLPIGLIAFIIIIATSSGDVKLADYFNVHSVLIVLGGTFATLAIGTPTSIIWALTKNMIALFKSRPSMKRIQSDLIKLSEDRNSVTKSHDPLVQYAISLWERGIDAQSWQALISQYRDKLENEDVESITALQNLSKYPPALGMMGTVMGMISLFANLGSSNKAALGPSLATAMTATFYGLLMANTFLNPVADRIAVEAMYRKKYFGLVYEILTLVNRREAPSMIKEEFEHREAA